MNFQLGKIHANDKKIALCFVRKSSSVVFPTSPARNLSRNNFSNVHHNHRRKLEDGKKIYRSKSRQTHRSCLKHACEAWQRCCDLRQSSINTRRSSNTRRFAYYWGPVQHSTCQWTLRPINTRTQQSFEEDPRQSTSAPHRPKTHERQTLCRESWRWLPPKEEENIFTPHVAKWKWIRQNSSYRWQSPALLRHVALHLDVHYPKVLMVPTATCSSQVLTKLSLLHTRTMLSL